MILDIDKFIASEKPCWQELENFLDRLDRGGAARLSIEEVKRLHYLYERVSEDLVKISTFSGEQEIRKYLGNLVARTYARIHSHNRAKWAFSFRKWFFQTFPQTFRRHIMAFYLALGITVLAAVFGGVAVVIDAEAKQAVIPPQFAHLHGDPGERVKREEGTHKFNPLAGNHSYFAAYLITHNIKVSINVFALGMTWGLGTVLLLFYNGVLLGAITVDYIASGYTSFLLGWLLPHGVIEIPAVLIAGQAGLVLGNSLLRPRGQSRIASLRANSRDIVTLIGGTAVLLCWAGVVEAFLSQYHWPVIPYSVKIAFGILELLILIIFLSWSGRKKAAVENLAHASGVSEGTDAE